jgi:hypothetical protein
MGVGYITNGIRASGSNIGTCMGQEPIWVKFVVTDLFVTNLGKNREKLE